MCCSRASISGPMSWSHPPRAGLCPAAQGTKQSPCNVSTDHLNHSFDATMEDRLLHLAHLHGKETASSALPGTAKSGITAAKWFHFAMQNSSCIHRDERQLIPIKLAVQSLSRSMMEIG